MKEVISSAKLQERIEAIAPTEVTAPKPKENLYILNTPKGQIKVKSPLEFNEFMESITKKKK